MPKQFLKPPMDTLESDIIETLLAGHKEWRPDLEYPESYSDMQGAVRGLLRMFEVKRRPIAVELEYDCRFCHGERTIKFRPDLTQPNSWSEQPCQCVK